MVYIAGITGFFAGFVLGQVMLMHWLKDRSKEEILHNRDLRWSYGVFNWLVAGLCSWLFVVMYNHYHQQGLIF